jgi:tagaturonate reductase
MLEIIKKMEGDVFMKTLNRELLKAKDFSVPEDIKVGTLADMPERVLQFGEGNFLRGFVDWMFDKLNKENLFNGKVVIIQGTPVGPTDLINNQDGLYTLYLRGIQNGATVEDKSIITSVSRCINPYQDFEACLKCAENPDLRIIVSNTTEAGIAYSQGDKIDDNPPSSYPAKLTALLYRRFKSFKGDLSKGFIIIPCELIDRNGDNLKRIVKQYALEWELEKEFISWLENANYFLNTLVDRIVTGYPKDEAEKITQELGYQDNLIDTAEIFHLWVIEGDKKLAEEIPFHKAGLNVIWTDNLTPYRSRKVRILNGAHTMTVLAAYMYGLDTVGQCMDDKLISAYMNKGIFEEIIPTLDLPESELIEFAQSVIERFKNPFITHYLLSISLNSMSKFKARVLPSILEYIKRKNKLPQVLTFSLAALIAFYKGDEIKGMSLIGNRKGNEYEINDDMPILEFYRDLWSGYDGSRDKIDMITRSVLSSGNLWELDLTSIDGLAEAVANHLYNIIDKGVEEAMRVIL